ncbi:right-handed parallel beta-helix repeat-containing protein [Methanosarcina sp. UBA5]|uniref:right-handed parallel beta-helix repeat-containing protein n=1 Tax=Methanosarcina sp. UBA5 TaxID=1915593 RepID=UPI0025F1DCB2|nr:NosD domain-containing protein [Methanosarcina sp. UBA5]
MIISRAEAATIIVDDDIEEANYQNIQDAVDNATSDDTILVYPGNYTENVYVDKELKIVSLSGNPDDTVIRAANSEDDVFNVVADNVTIKGFGISGARTDQYGDDKAGIYFEGVNNSVIKKNNVFSNGYGIFLLDSYNNTLTENNAYMSGIGGIFLWNSSNNKLNNNLINATNHEGIYIYTSSNNNEISNNTVTYAGFGIDLVYCENNKIVNNTISNTVSGIFLSKSSRNFLISNVANLNSWSGIDLEYSTENTLYNNTANFNNNNGIFLIESRDNRLDYNNVSNNAEYGININNSSRNNVLTGNIANSNGKKNIHVVDPENNTINGLAQEVPFQGSVLTIITIITITLILGKSIYNQHFK